MSEPIKRPRWLDSAEKSFKETFNGGSGSPRHIARTCCEVSAWFNDKRVGGDVVVNTRAVLDGLAAYDQVHAGEQPYLNIGIVIETSHPYRALIFEGEAL